jgi:hypothetical protein
MSGAFSTVIPAKAGIHSPCGHGSFDIQRQWIPAFAGMTAVK